MNIVVNKNFKKVSLLSLITLIILSSAIAPAKCNGSGKESIIRNWTTITLINEDLLRVEMKYKFNLNEKTLNRIKEKFSGNPAIISLCSNSVSTIDYKPELTCLLNKQQIYSDFLQYRDGNLYMYTYTIVNFDVLQGSELSFSFDIEASQFRINEGIIEFEVVFNRLTDFFDDVPHKFDLIVCSESNEWSGWLWTLETQWISDCLVHKSPLYKIEDLPKKHEIQFNQCKVTRLTQSYFIEDNGNITQEFQISLEIPHGNLRFQIPYIAGIEKPNIDEQSYILLNNGERKNLKFYGDLSDPKEILEKGTYGWAYDDKSNYIIFACSDPDAKEMDIKYTNKNLYQICDKKGDYVYECKFPILISPPFKDDLVVTIDINDFHFVSSVPNPKFEWKGKRLIYKFEGNLPDSIELKYVTKEKLILDRISAFNVFLSVILFICIIIFFRTRAKLKNSSKILKGFALKEILLPFLSLLFMPIEYFLTGFYELNFIEFVIYTKLYFLIPICGVMIFLYRSLQEKTSKERLRDTGIY